MEYIPGYTTLKDTIGQAPKKLYEYFTSKLPNKYELFATQSNATQSNAKADSSWFSGTIAGIDEANIPRWSSAIEYKKDDYVKHQGFIYKSRKDSSNVNPIESITDDFITVNSDYWISEGLSSNVKKFDPDRDVNTTYTKDTIVNFNSVLYSCMQPGSNCTSDYTKNVWKKLSSDYIAPYIPTSNLSYTDQVTRTSSTFISDMINEFTIEEIPGESLYDTSWRVGYIVYNKLFFIVPILLAFVFASFSANDLLHKKAPFRILAYIYTFLFVSYQTSIGYLIFFYYLFRSLFGWSFNMNPLKIYAILPLKEDLEYNESSMFPSLYTYPASLREYIEEGRKISNVAKLASQGDILGMIARSLRVPLNSQGLSIHRKALGEIVPPQRTAAGAAAANSTNNPGPPTQGGTNAATNTAPNAGATTAAPNAVPATTAAPNAVPATTTAPNAANAAATNPRPRPTTMGGFPYPGRFM